MYFYFIYFNNQTFSYMNGKLLLHFCRIGVVSYTDTCPWIWMERKAQFPFLTHTYTNTQWNCSKNFPFTATTPILTEKEATKVQKKRNITKKCLYTSKNNTYTHTKGTRIVIIYDFLQWIGIVWWCLFIYIWKVHTDINTHTHTHIHIKYYVTSMLGGCMRTSSKFHHIYVSFVVASAAVFKR